VSLDEVQSSDHLHVLDVVPCSLGDVMFETFVPTIRGQGSGSCHAMGIANPEADIYFKDHLAKAGGVLAQQRSLQHVCSRMKQLM
jgi:hypothetical protein